MKHIYIFYGLPQSGKSMLGRMIEHYEDALIIDDYVESYVKDLDGKEHLDKVTWTCKREYEVDRQFRDDIIRFISHSQQNEVIIITQTAFTCAMLNMRLGQAVLDQRISLSHVYFEHVGRPIPFKEFNDKTLQ